MRLAPGVDATSVAWLHVDPEAEPRFASMHAAQREIVYLAANRLHVHSFSRLNTLRHKRYPARFNVSDQTVPWGARLLDYNPEDYTDDRAVAIRLAWLLRKTGLKLGAIGNADECVLAWHL